MVRRLVSRTMARQLGEAVRVATAPFQYALSTRAGCECVAHVLQAVTEADPSATVLSMDGISVFDSISREAMLRGLCRADGGESALPFVRMFYGEPSIYLWEGEGGTVHDIHQGEGGEQGDPLMPLLFSLGQHPALEAVQAQMPNEKVFAFMDDVYMTTRPERVGVGHTTLGVELFRHAGIHIHEGKTKVWNSGDIRPQACDQLERLAREANARTTVWRGSPLPSHEQDIKVLGAPLGHPEFVAAHLARTVTEHEVLLRRIPSMQDLQNAWLLLLHCAAAKATYLTRVLPPQWSAAFATAHDQGLWHCMCRLLNVVPDQVRHQASCDDLPCARWTGLAQCSENEFCALIGPAGQTVCP